MRGCATRTAAVAAAAAVGGLVLVVAMLASGRDSLRAVWMSGGCGGLVSLGAARKGGVEGEDSQVLEPWQRLGEEQEHSHNKHLHGKHLHGKHLHGYHKQGNEEQVEGLRFGDDAIQDVHIVFSSHFDMGYTKNVNGSCAGAVLNQYFHEHFPKAIRTAARVKAMGHFEYQWVGQSWIVDAFFSCEDTKVGLGTESELQCPTEAEKQAVEEAIRQGVITWHAFPFNAEPEMFTPHLFRAGFDMTSRLDDRFELPRKRTLSQRDVPGITRAVIPLMAAKNVTAMSIGENTQCAAVNVPPIFVWRDVATDTEVLAMFHFGGYGRRRRQLHAWHSVDNADGGDHCVLVPAARTALCFAWRQDNTGPHAHWDAELSYDLVRLRFPHARLHTKDSFDRFVSAVEPVKDQLPVVTQEIGDTWIYGATSDPVKVSLFRAASRIHASCLDEGGPAACMGTNSMSAVRSFRAFERLLMTVGEHTWGWDGGRVKFLAWSNPELQGALKRNRFFNMTVQTWVEQRSFLYNALAVLPPTAPLAKAVREEWRRMSAAGTRFSHDHGTDGLHDMLDAFSCGGFSVRLNAQGGIVSLQNKAGGPNWASETRPLMRPWYQNMDQAFFQDFGDQYVFGLSRLLPNLVAENLLKPGLKLPAISSNVTVTKLTVGDDHFVVDMKTDSARAHVERGAPATFQAQVWCGKSELEYELRWFDKTPTKGPETVWLSNLPRPKADQVLVHKLDAFVDAEEADLGCDGRTQQGVATCGVHLHAVGDEGATQRSGRHKLQIIPVDSALVSVGVANPLPTPLVKPDIQGGLHFPLVGNLWNTNYPFWYPFITKDSSSSFRFTIRTSVSKSHLEQHDLTPQ